MWASELKEWLDLGPKLASCLGLNEQLITTLAAILADGQVHPTKQPKLQCIIRLTEIYNVTTSA